jgi:hypothetical protein
MSRITNIINDELIKFLSTTEYINEIQFKQSVPDIIGLNNDDMSLLLNGMPIPITNKLGEFLYNKKRINAFHVSEVLQINNMKNIIGKNKTISAFTNFLVGRNGIDDDIFKGSQTNGGILYKINGELLLSSTIDVYSRPDENGIRWVGTGEIIPRNLRNDFEDGLDNIIKKYVSDGKFGYSAKPMGRGAQSPIGAFLSDKTNKNRTNLIRDYITYTQDYIMSHKDEILSYLAENKDNRGENWNEVLLTNITILEIMWSPSTIFHYDNSEDNYYMYGRKYTEDEDGRLNNKYIIEKEELPQYINYIQKLLESLTNGKVYNYQTDNISVEEFLKS